MGLNTIPKYSKVEVMLKKSDDISTTVEVFLDCGVMITGDYLIVIMDEKNDIKTSATSTGNIFPLSKVKSYRTHAE